MALRRYDSFGPQYSAEKLGQVQHGSNCVEFQFGSDLSIHHKLLIWKERFSPRAGEPVQTLIRFAFDPNGIQEQECQPRIAQFTQAIAEILERRR